MDPISSSSFYCPYPHFQLQPRNILSYSLIEFRAHFPAQLTDLSPQVRIGSRGMRFSPCARFDSVVELLPTHPIITQFPRLLYLPHSVIFGALLPRPLRIAHATWQNHPCQNRPYPLQGRSPQRSIDCMKHRAWAHALLLRPPSRRRNTRSTIRTRFQHPIAHPFLKKTAPSSSAPFSSARFAYRDPRFQ